MADVMAAVTKSTTAIFDGPVGIVLIIYDMSHSPLPETRYYTNIPYELSAPILTAVTNVVSEKVNNMPKNHGEC